MKILICPSCREFLLDTEDLKCEESQGKLPCKMCGAEYDTMNGIPNFSSTSNNYAENFGYEWNKWGRVQLDSAAGHKLSEDRFFRDTGWDPAWLSGKYILDAGCGAGRFTEIAAKYGANVVAVDLSSAIHAARSNLENYKNIQFVQASLFNLPLACNSFDGIYCFGVIQHTPDPLRIIKTLPNFLRSGGLLAYNYYEKTDATKLQLIKYGLRFFTKRFGNKTNYFVSMLLTLTFFPITYALNFFPGLRILNHIIPVCASHYQGLTFRQQFVWTLLDTFDWYSPKYEQRQSSAQVRRLLELSGIHVDHAAAGVARGVKTSVS